MYAQKNGDTPDVDHAEMYLRGRDTPATSHCVHLLKSPRSYRQKIVADDVTHLRNNCIVKRPQETRCKNSAYSAKKQNFDFDIEEIEERTDFKNERINRVEEVTTKNRHAHHMPILFVVWFLYFTSTPYHLTPF